MCGPNHRPEAIHDTADITYRCFLPDLTRFVRVCCVATGRMNPGHTSQGPGIGRGGGPPRVIYGNIRRSRDNSSGKWG